MGGVRLASMTVASGDTASHITEMQVVDGRRGAFGWPRGRGDRYFNLEIGSGQWEERCRERGDRFFELQDGRRGAVRLASMTVASGSGRGDRFFELQDGRREFILPVPSFPPVLPFETYKSAFKYFLASFLIQVGRSSFRIISTLGAAPRTFAIRNALTACPTISL